MTKDYSQRIPTCFWVAIGLVAIATLIHFTIEPDPAHADTKASATASTTPALYSKSDKEQETEFCKQIMNGVPVHGANVSQVELHCMRH